MKFQFGVSSDTPANQTLSNGYTLFDWVMRQRCFPSFWGRPISGTNAVSKNEIEFLKERNCKVMLLFTDFSEAEISANSGRAVAIRAINAAVKLGIPQNRGLAIFVDVPTNWSINHNWMLSFARLLEGHGYIPGFIGNTDSSLNFNFDRQSSHYVQAFEGGDAIETVFGATEPKINAMPNKWFPYAPSALNSDDMALWVSGELNYKEHKVKDIYVRKMNTLDYLR